MNLCIRCGKPLKTETSKAIGYGQSCAKKAGVPWWRTPYEQARDLRDRLSEEEKQKLRRAA